MTQKEQILEYLKRFKTITPMEAFADLGITKLATRVSEMRREGIEFHIETIRKENRFGKKIRYCKYSLKETNV